MPFLPNYITSLSREDLKRYELEVQLCGGVDPFEVEPGWNSVSVVPEVTREDLMQYLVLKTDFYSLKQLKNYKSLESHNFVTSGNVKGCTTLAICKRKVIAFGKGFHVRSLDPIMTFRELLDQQVRLFKIIVTHSQRLNEPPLKCWTLLQMDGKILTGHCNCMAGTGEVCSHVGAILFYLELSAKKIRETTCTSLPNAWLQPAQSSGPMRSIKECDFRSAGTKWKDLMDGGSAAPKQTKRRLPSGQWTAKVEEVHELLAKAKSKGIDSADDRFGFSAPNTLRKVDTQLGSQTTPKFCNAVP